MTITQKPLPYNTNAFEPIISARTFDHHYNYHHKGYIDKLNLLLSKDNIADLSLLEILSQYAPNTPIWNNAAQHHHHEFYWDSLSASDTINDTMQKLIEASFCSHSAFEEKMVAAAAGLFGSGWVWLIYNRDTNLLEIESTQNANFPAHHPLLVLDVWEHAYYLDYQQQRTTHIAQLLKYLNWSMAHTRLSNI